MPGTRSGSIFRPLAIAAVMTALTSGQNARASEDWSATLAAGCFTPTCIALGLAGDALDALASDPGASAETLAAGIQYWSRGTDPLAVRLMAIRYQDGRLVRYGVSPRIELPAHDAPAALPDAPEAVTRAFRPVTERAVLIRSAGDGGSAYAPIALDSFLGNLPPTFLAGNGDGRLIVAGAEDALGTAVDGAVGVLLLLPEDPEQRGANDTQSFGLLVRLESVRR